MVRHVLLNAMHLVVAQWTCQKAQHPNQFVPSVEMTESSTVRSSALPSLPMAVHQEPSAP